ncbi:MAG: COX15/CtaA family protein [Gammaproteobacteria bacterium]
MIRALSLCLPALALVVIVFGAYVRLTDAGLGCPDWPGCYGRLTVPEHRVDVHLDNPDWSARPLDTGKAWREMIHRYLASALGFGIVILALFVARSPGSGAAVKVVYGLVPLVMFQGALGMWTVTLMLKPLVVSAHLLGGLATLALLWWNLLSVTAGQRSGREAGSRPILHWAALAALAVLVFQIFLGGWTSANYAALACTDFPTCHGRWWPQTDFAEAFVLWRGLGINYEFGVLETPARTAIHMAHRLGALATLFVVATAAVLALRSSRTHVRRVGWCILAALSVQLILGMGNILGGLPLAVAVAHNAGAAILLLTLVTLIHFTRQLRSN